MLVNGRRPSVGSACCIRIATTPLQYRSVRYVLSSLASPRVTRVFYSLTYVYLLAYLRRKVQEMCANICHGATTRRTDWEYAMLQAPDGGRGGGHYTNRTGGGHVQRPVAKVAPITTQHVCHHSRRPHSCCLSELVISHGYESTRLGERTKHFNPPSE